MSPKAKESARLFQGLQEFTNLSDDRNAYEMFARTWSDFFPVSLYNAHDTQEKLTWGSNCHRLVLAFRDALRDLWRLGSNRSLAILLGIDRETWNLINNRSAPGTLASILSPNVETNLYEAMRDIPDEYFADLPQLSSDWRSGNFRYIPKNDFQRAVDLLWRQNWRAKTCLHCGKYFVADKPAQMYCSMDCSTLTKRARALEWWHNHGEEWRKTYGGVRPGKKTNRNRKKKKHPKIGRKEERR